MDLKITDTKATGGGCDCGCAHEAAPEAVTAPTCGCDADCTCGCQEGKPCTCGPQGSTDCGCGPDCTCGCQEGKPCTCGPVAKADCGCGPDCTCGCQEGKPCTCGPQGVTDCGCGPDCTCGCQEGKPCTCGPAASGADVAGAPSVGASGGEATTSYTVSGMTCGHCVKAVTEEVSAIDGVTGVSVDLESGAMKVTATKPIDFDRIVEAVAEAGDYTVE